MIADRLPFFRSKFGIGFCFKMIIVHGVSSNARPACWCCYHLINTPLPTYFGKRKHFLLFHLLKMIPYPRGLGSCHAVHLSFIDWRFIKLISKCFRNRKVINFWIATGGFGIHVYKCIGYIILYARRRHVFSFGCH